MFNGEQGDIGGHRALKDDNDTQPLPLHPVLKLAEFDLKFADFAFVFLAREFYLFRSGVGIVLHLRRESCFL
jgi:hypothetical protein